MRFGIEVCLLGTMLACAAGAQDPRVPVLRPGVSVKMAVAAHAEEIRAADNLDAVVVAITADGKIYVGTTLTEPAALSRLQAPVVYLKADSRVPFQRVIGVLDALRGTPVAFLTEAPAGAARQHGIVAPYGLKPVQPR